MTEKVNLFVCPWCFQDFLVSGRSFGAHKTNCKQNPKHQEIVDKAILNSARCRTKARETITKTCRCGTEFSFERIIGSTYEKKCCSRKCANVRIHSDETKAKISVALTHESVDKVCPICNSIFHSVADTCSRSCGATLRASDPAYRQKISTAVKGKTGGWRNFGGSGMKGTYKGFIFQSSWELAWLAYHLDHKVSFRRCDEFFEYEFDGKKSKYYPDFFLEDEQIYVEIKGFMSERTRAKLASIPNGQIKVLMHKEMAPYLSYARAKGLFTHQGIAP